MSALELVRYEPTINPNVCFLRYWANVQEACTPAGARLCLLAAPLSHKRWRYTPSDQSFSNVQVLALPFILQGLSMRGSLMGGWKNSLSAIPQLVQVMSILGTNHIAWIRTRSRVTWRSSVPILTFWLPETLDWMISTKHSPTSAASGTKT